MSLISSCNEIFSDKNSRENQNTHFVSNKLFFEDRALYEITWKNIVQPSRPHMTWRKPIACWIHKVTNTHSELYTDCFSTATMVARLRLNVTLCYVASLISVDLVSIKCGKV
jgi:hypothetical protein